MLRFLRKTLGPFAAKLFALLVFLLIGLCCPRASHAAGCSGSSPTWTAASAAAADVQACLSEPLQCGDTVVIPSGSATWTTQVKVTPPTGCATNQGIIVQGATACTAGCAAGSAGVGLAFTDNTVITLDASTSGFFVGPCSNTSFCTITGITFVNGTVQSNGNFNVQGTHGQVSFRVHHVHYMNSLSGGVDLFMYDGYGLLDHYLVDDTNASNPATPVNVGGDFSSRGYQNWMDPTNPGTNQSVVIEDTVANMQIPNAEGFIDSYYGCKVTIRYSIINGNSIGGWHGTDSGGYRGCVLGEYYNNTITNNTGKIVNIMGIRSGVLLFFNNTVNGSTGWNGIPLNFYRISEPGSIEQGNWGAAGAGLNWTPVSTTMGTSGASENTLNAPDWQANHSYASGAVIGPTSNNSANQNFQNGSICISGSSRPTFPALPNTDNATVTDGTCIWNNIAGTTTASSAPGVSAGFCAANPDTPATSNATCSALVPGDTATRYFDSNGGVYPFRDQPCVIHNQVVYGCYAWGNTLPSSLSVSTLLGGDSSGAVISGRDYFNNTQPSSYTPYTYPHPLQSGTQAPAPPTNVTAVVD